VRAHGSKARRGPDHEPVGGRLVAERVGTGQHFIGDDRNSPQIPRRKRLLAEPLFRRHVAGRAQKRARSSVSSALLRSGRKEFGDAKVQHLGNIPPLTAHQKDILGLQITMDKLAVMGCPVSCAPTPISWPFTKASRSELIWSALVVGMPCGKLVQLLVQIA